MTERLADLRGRMGTLRETLEPGPDRELASAMEDQAFDTLFQKSVTTSGDRHETAFLTNDTKAGLDLLNEALTQLAHLPAATLQTAEQNWQDSKTEAFRQEREDHWNSYWGKLTRLGNAYASEMPTYQSTQSHHCGDPKTEVNIRLGNLIGTLEHEAPTQAPILDAAYHDIIHTEKFTPEHASLILTIHEKIDPQDHWTMDEIGLLMNAAGYQIKEGQARGTRPLPHTNHPRNPGVQAPRTHSLNQ